MQKRNLPILLSILFSVTASAEWSNWPPIVETKEIREVGARMSPLVAKEVKNGIVTFTWDPKIPEHGRRLSGKRPKEDAPSLISLRLSHIAYRHSSDDKRKEEYRKLFNEGLEQILEGRSLGIETTDGRLFSSTEIGEIVISGIIALNEYFTLTVQERMVALGYAQVETRHSSPMVRTYGDDFRDNLLRLEGIARHLQLGIWNDN